MNGNEEKGLTMNLGHWPFEETDALYLSLLPMLDVYLLLQYTQASIHPVQKTSPGTFLLCVMVESWISPLCYLCAPNVEIFLKVESKILFGREMSSGKYFEMRKAALKICLWL